MFPLSNTRERPYYDLTPQVCAVSCVAEAVGEVCSRKTLTQGEINQLYTILHAVSRRIEIEEAKSN